MGLIMQNGISYGGADIVKLTQTEYDALPESKYSDGILYAITDGENSSGSTSKPIELTKAQYEALGESTKTDGILYAITDGDELSAKNMAYDGSVTGLGNNVQSAIDELNSNLSKASFELLKETTGSGSGDKTFTFSFDDSFASDDVICINVIQENNNKTQHFNEFFEIPVSFIPISTESLTRYRKYLSLASYLIACFAFTDSTKKSLEVNLLMQNNNSSSFYYKIEVYKKV